MCTGMLLKQFFNERGITASAVAESLGISRSGLYKKLEGKTDFTMTEARKIMEFARMNNEEIVRIFFS